MANPTIKLGGRLPDPTPAAFACPTWERAMWIDAVVAWRADHAMPNPTLPGLTEEEIDSALANL